MYLSISPLVVCPYTHKHRRTLLCTDEACFLWDVMVGVYSSPSQRCQLPTTSHPIDPGFCLSYQVNADHCQLHPIDPGFCLSYQVNADHCRLHPIPQILASASHTFILWRMDPWHRHCIKNCWTMLLLGLRKPKHRAASKDSSSFSDLSIRVCSKGTSFSSFPNFGLLKGNR